MAWASTCPSEGWGRRAMGTGWQARLSQLRVQRRAWVRGLEKAGGLWEEGQGVWLGHPHIQVKSLVSGEGG